MGFDWAWAETIIDSKFTTAKAKFQKISQRKIAATKQKRIATQSMTFAGSQQKMLQVAPGTYQNQRTVTISQRTAQCIGSSTRSARPARSGLSGIVASVRRTKLHARRDKKLVYCERVCTAIDEPVRRKLVLHGACFEADVSYMLDLFTWKPKWCMCVLVGSLC